jgi:hypothetical protein
MNKNLKSIFVLVSLLILVVFVLFVISQTSQVAALAARANPVLGKAVFWFLILVYLVLIIVPFFLFLRLPKALTPPEESEDEALNLYLIKLTKRLKNNSRLKGIPLATRYDLEQALNTLVKEADQVIKKNAAMVFLTTAISQSGRLDAFTVLIAQVRMIWQVAQIFYQRPMLKEMTWLYANVAATAFVASEISDIDVSRQVEPIITSVLGASLTGTIPGVNRVAGIVTNSLLTGSANAYLTLRVGAIAKRYCGSLVKKERSAIRRSATVEAARLLTKIVMDSAGSISKAFVTAAVKSPGRISREVVRSTFKKIKKKGEGVEPDVSGNPSE